MTSHLEVLFHKHLLSYMYKTLKRHRETHRWVLSAGFPVCRSPSDHCVLLLATVVQNELASRSGPLNSCLCDPERVSGEIDSWSSWTHAEGGREKTSKRLRRREREERGTAHSYPPSGPLHCHPPLSKPPLPDPPGCKFLVCGPNTKIPNPSKSQAKQLTDSHTCPPTPHFLTPLIGPTTHLVSFKLNPCKSPKLSHPFLPPFSHLPPIYLYLPPPSCPLFFHKATKALVQSDMQDIYSRGERS